MVKFVNVSEENLDLDTEEEKKKLKNKWWKQRNVKFNERNYR